VYAVCESAPETPEKVFARDGFWVLGPLPGDKANFDPVEFSTPFMAGGVPETSYAVHWVGSIAWKALQPARAMILDPDIIPTSGKANTPDNYPGDAFVYSSHTNVHYLLYGRILSPEDRNVRLVIGRGSVKRLSLNGQRVEGATLALRKGANDVRILYAPSLAAGATFNEANYGCYFRLTDADGKRMDDVSFERPPKP